MALPDDHEEPDEHAAAPLLPPEDRLWRHPSELRSHPRQSTGTSASAAPQRLDRPAGRGGMRFALVTVACMAGVAMVAGALWVSWPRESDELADGSGAHLNIPPTSLDGPPMPATAARTRFIDLFSPDPPRPAAPTPGRLGVQVVDFSSPLPGLPSSTAAEVVEVENESAAQGVGLQPGDLIVRVGTHPIQSANDLVEAIGGHEPGDEVEVGVARRGPEGRVDRYTISVRLGG